MICKRAKCPARSGPTPFRARTGFRRNEVSCLGAVPVMCRHLTRYPLRASIGIPQTDGSGTSEGFPYLPQAQAFGFALQGFGEPLDRFIHRLIAQPKSLVVNGND